MKDHKVLLVTGASSDIGMELIRTISKEYDYIWAHYNRSSERMNMLKEEFGDRILPVHADFSKEDDINAMTHVISESGIYPDHIVHLSSLNTFNQKFHKCNWNDYQNGIDTSLRSIVMILEEFIPRMMKERYGKVVFMLSAYVIGVPPKYQSPYITVKYALLGLMETLASEYAEKGITVNAVSPEMTETRFLDNIPELIVRQNAERNPLKRNLSVSDVIPAFQYLLSDGSDMVTGLNLGVTGGGR